MKLILVSYFLIFLHSGKSQLALAAIKYNRSSDNFFSRIIITHTIIYSYTYKYSKRYMTEYLNLYITASIAQKVILTGFYA